MTPEGWRSDNDWKHGPRRIVVSGERPDPAQLPETAGESDPPPSRRRVSLDDIALLLRRAKGAKLRSWGLSDQRLPV